MTARRHRRMGALMLLVTLVTLATAGCASGPVGAPGSPTPTATPSAVGLPGTHWTADQIGPTPALAATAPTATFGADGTVTGSGGCNRFTTRYTTNGTDLRIDEAIASTMMACPRDVMAQEASFLAALAAARSYSLTAERLTLTNEAGATVVTFVPQSRSLTGTWDVTGYHNGASAVISPVVGSSPALEFTDTTLTGTAGCNQLNGTYHLDGTTISVGPLVATQKSCSEPAGIMEQEAALTAALESATTVSLDGNALELRRADGDLAVRATRR